MPATRIETDSMGPIAVPADRYWGAQTQRALVHFSVGTERLPVEVFRALALVKKAAASANAALGRLPADKETLIAAAADEVIAGRLDDHFPLKVWISGSGTQANMNANEVIANRANEMAGGVLGSKQPIHPNDHVNMSQSTNDVFPTAMHIAAAKALEGDLIPAATAMRRALADRADAWRDIVKIGRTHLQDAVPMTLGQEFSGYADMLDHGLAALAGVLPGLRRLAVGGTAVGTGLNAPAGFTERVIRNLADLAGADYAPAANAFAALGSRQDLVAASAAMRGLAVSLNKIACDIRLLGCGPRAGLGELALPANEPGSSIMPGKVNPTQCETMTQAAIQVMGLDAAVAQAAAGGILELNVYQPLIIFNVLTQARLLADVCRSFTEHLLAGVEPNRGTIEAFVVRSLMLVTALSPKIGYDKAARIAHLAHEQGLTLREAALSLGFVTAEEFDRIVDPRAMARPHG